MASKLFITTFLVGCTAAGAAFAAGVTVAGPGGGGSPVDFAAAKPLPLPQATVAPDTLAAALAAPIPAFAGPAGATSGAVGDGKTHPVLLPVNKALRDSEGIAPAQFGSSNQPFTTARADAYSLKVTSNYPFRAAGKLFFKIGTGNYICSASLIKRGLVVTAAHCVANFGKSQFYSSWQFVPGYSSGSAPYGTWTVRKARVMTSYYAGTETCATAGVVCPNDVAVLELNAQSGAYPGTNTGYFGYGWDGYGFTGSGVSNNNLTQVTQLGYPAGLDSGAIMERTDSYGYTSSSSSYNTIIGSQQTGGSSGGPWLVNFGLAPTVTNSVANQGSEAGSNRVVGTTSWGYTAPNTQKVQGAAPFRSTNIVKLVTDACAGAASSAVCN